MSQIFHLAIPTHDIALSEDFYTRVIGAQRARIYDDRVTFKFFDHQIVCHLAPDEIDKSVKMYPRHFGMTFIEKAEFDKLYQKCLESGYPFFQERTMRWPERPEKHETFFIADPSNNLLEFKYYLDSKYAY